MKTDNTGRAARRGFTMLELLVVISIMAILATLAVGAASKAIKQSRSKRIDAMIMGLQVALQNYRAQENEWPFSLSDLIPGRGDGNPYWCHGADNYKIFKKMYHGAAGESRTVFLDASALFTIVDSERMTLRSALELRRTNAPLGYPLPNDTSVFKFFCVCYQPLTDTVKVVREGEDHICTR
jgi:prepilin-type N-terminal cleavage/methylation domain-containing protein